MNRRSLLQALGLAAVAPMLPTIPAAAETFPTPTWAADALAKQFKDPLYAIAFTEGSRGERYRHWMPATISRPKNGGIVVNFMVTFTGTVRSVEIARGDVNLVTVYADAFDSPHWVNGMAARIRLDVSSNTLEDA